MLRPSMSLLIAGLSLLTCPCGSAAEMAMGFRVGEVTQDSAIVWTRVTRDPQRKWDGYREPKKRQPKQSTYVASEIRVEDRDGATPGAVGQVRVVYSTSE